MLPGYTTVARASEVLHLAPRSVRDLIYSGRVPSLRIGRLHYVRAGDLELERRRRRGLPPPRRTARPSKQRSSAPVERKTRERVHADPTLRRQRALERAADVSRWAERHHPAEPGVPFAAGVVAQAGTCPICGRQLRAGARVVDARREGAQLCLTCGRRALLDWADRRRLEAAAARQLAQTLGASAQLSPSPRVA